MRYAHLLMLLSVLLSTPALAQTDAGTDTEQPSETTAPEGHEPALNSALDAQDGISVGQSAKLTITATLPEGDDVTLPKQGFEPLELLNSTRARGNPKDGKVTFTFVLDLIAFEAGDVPLDSVQLRIVTKDGAVFARTAPPVTLHVKSLIGNEPNAELKPATKPVDVMEDNLTPIYLLLGLLGALAVAVGTLWLQRYLAARQQESLPPPPPRPPWEIAVEKLAELRRRKQDMVAAGEAVEFVDRVSDVVREYLGRCFSFAGLDSTTAELLEHLRNRRAPTGLQEESRDYLRRCDLVKFAKVEPDQDEVDLILAKAQDIVQFSMPSGTSPAHSSSPGESGGER